MLRLPLLLGFLTLSSALAAAPTARLREFNIDVSGTGLLPVTWASDSPTLTHWGYDAKLGLEYDPPPAFALRLELGYLNVAASSISSSGELYRAWEGLRIALLCGYDFASIPIGELGDLAIGGLAGGAVTAGDYKGTSLAMAYPSLVLEPRLALSLRGLQSKSSAQGPWLAFPVELMFRAGTHTIASGLSLGWRYRMGVSL
jgi:hypothetical protein